MLPVFLVSGGGSGVWIEMDEWVLCELCCLAFYACSWKFIYIFILFICLYFFNWFVIFCIYYIYIFIKILLYFLFDFIYKFIFYI